jgi:hypothetical protein
MLQNRLIFLTDVFSERLHYVVQLVFKEHLDLDVFLTTDKSLFLESALPKVAYTSNIELSNSILFIEKKSNILFDNHISKEDPNLLFQEADVLGKIFFLVSRYEEYIVDKNDNLSFDSHNRFRAFASINQKEGFLRKPIVNQWIIQIKNQLNEKFMGLNLIPKSFQFIPTYDVDQAWSVRHKGLLRNIGGFLKELSQGQIKVAFRRIFVLMNLQKDPEYTFDFLNQLDKKYNLKPNYFWLLGDHSEHDKNIHWQNRSFQNLIRRISKTHLVGLHPSYLSNDNDESLTNEKYRFETITKHPLSISRQHYLKLSFPETYRRLIGLGVDVDYSMGYNDDVGFRAGLCTPFYWFDLLENKQTNLRVYPFAVMEITLKEYLKLDRQEALSCVKELIDEVKKVEGTFISLWHNSTLSDKDEWQGWRQVYVDMIDYISKIK